MWLFTSLRGDGPRGASVGARLPTSSSCVWGEAHEEADGGGWVTCEWAVPSEGASGSFDAGFNRDDDMATAVVEQFAERVGDLAAECWRQPRPSPS